MSGGDLPEVPPAAISEPGSVRLDELPLHPTGWTKRMSLHLNFGRGKGVGVYTIHDEQGRRVEGIGYSYNAGEGLAGFTLGDGEVHYPDWMQLCQAYKAAR